MRKKLLAGGLWLTLTKFATFLITFGGGVVLARILDPEIFGMVAMATAVSAIGTKFSLIGIRPEIIRLNETDADYSRKLSTIFWLNFALTVCGALALVLIVDYFDWLTHPASLIFPTLICGWALDNCMLPARAVLHKNQRYKSIFALRVFVPLASVPIAIAMALQGFEIWSLVLPQAAALALAGWLAFVMAKIPFSFSFCRLTAISIFSNGRWYLVHNIMAGGYTNVDRLLVGSYLGNSILGLYHRSYSLSQLFQQQLGTLLYTLGLPVFSKSGDMEEAKIKFLKFGLKFVCYLICPAIVAFSIFAQDIITFVYGEKWKAAADFFSYLVPFAVLWSIYQLLKGKLIGSGEIRFIAIVDVIKLGVMIVFCFFAIESLGVLGIGIGLSIGALLGNLFLLRRIIQHDVFGFLSEMIYPFIFFPLTILISIFFEKYLALFVLAIITLFFFWIERRDIMYVMKGREVL